MTAQDIPSVRQLRVFAAIADSQSISAAAKAVNLSQPGVTQSLRTLEHRVGAELFERRGAGSYLIESGAILLPRVQRFFDQLCGALDDKDAAVGSRALEVAVNRITEPQIRSLIAVSQHNSFSAAARALNITEPSLHRAAKGLERELRRRLYQRTSSGITTTALGTEIARRFQLALRELAYGIEELQAARGNVVTRIVIGNIPHSGTRILSSAINDFVMAYPTSTVQIIDGHYEALLDDLRAGRLDLLFGVLRRPAWAKDVTEETLCKNHYVVVGRVGHPLSRAKTVNLRALAQYDWIMPGAMTPRQQAFRRMFAPLSVLPRISVETTSTQIYRDLLATTDALTLMSVLEVLHNNRTELAILPFRSSELRRSDGLAIRADWQPTPIHDHFLTLLRAHARRLGSVRHTEGTTKRALSERGSEPATPATTAQPARGLSSHTRSR
jgi:LysR family transcriptional regulator, regulator for genes of the gallate degradation pathway